MSVCFLAAALVLCVQPQAPDAPDAPEGRWSGAILISGIELAMNATFGPEPGTAKLDIPSQGAFDLPLKNVLLEATSVHFELEAGPGLAVFESTSVTPERIDGRFEQGLAKGSFFLEPNPETSLPGAHAAEVEVTVEVEGGELHGALARPDDVATSDLVILHGGSGPTTRDGNSQGVGGRPDSLLLLSDALVERGLAVLRFDKRGVGASVSAVEGEMLFNAYVPDLLAWVAEMRADSRFERILLAGHSEGALVATLAAQAGGIDGLILIAGAGRPMDEVLLEQLGRSLPPALIEESQTLVAGLLEGKQSESISPALQSLFRPSVQPYLISLFQHDPAAALQSVEVPVLILQGTTDIQISVADAKALAAAKPDARMVLLEGMNHVLKTVSGNRTAQLPSYGDPSLPVHGPLVDSILAFVRD